MDFFCYIKKILYICIINNLLIKNKMDIFFNTSLLNINDKISLLNYAFENNDKYYIDILDITKSIRREKAMLSFDEVMEMFDNKCHFVVIKRDDKWTGSQYGEIGFCTLANKVDYFLFIYVNTSVLNDIISKFNINEEL